jgi:hypothetical protein
MGRFVIVVPLREDAHREALTLLRQGPPPLRTSTA